ncbi:chorismate mutase [Streptococcus sp. CSL10205-OR2]|uniref:chorismate mutase n=1 Tax=Streptococcus sp. CSL10205-OR2 TaxID=2980558 RepID=UPI0021D9940C|nr:chorismate mutase [Streptococcus sp. CSL10205-OR2]MCU9534261.1 chorismate mutase [Streptococcus sp. CSL10205-OR2]
MTLEKSRQAIDLIDKTLISLLEERMTLVSQVVAYKKSHNMPVLDQQREEDVLKKVTQEIKNDLYQEAIVATFKDIMFHSKKFQEERLRDDY